MGLANWFNRNFLDARYPIRDTSFKAPHGFEWEMGEPIEVQTLSPNKPRLAAVNTAPSRDPRLAAVNSAPTRDEFAAWRDDPVTQFVFTALRAAAMEQREQWLRYTWHKGNVEPDDMANYRLVCKVRSDAYEAMEDADYEAFCEWAGVEPEPEPRGPYAA